MHFIGLARGAGIDGRDYAVSCRAEELHEQFGVGAIIEVDVEAQADTLVGLSAGALPPLQAR